MAIDQAVHPGRGGVRWMTAGVSAVLLMGAAIAVAPANPDAARLGGGHTAVHAPTVLSGHPR